MFNQYLPSLDLLSKTMTFVDALDEKSFVSEFIRLHYRKYKIFFDLVKDIPRSMVNTVSVDVCSNAVTFRLEHEGVSDLGEYLSGFEYPGDNLFKLNINSIDGLTVIDISNDGFPREEDLYEN